MAQRIVNRGKNAVFIDLNFLFVSELPILSSWNQISKRKRSLGSVILNNVLMFVFLFWCGFWQNVL